LVTCPECGAAVPAVAAGRWLAVHQVGSDVYAYPRGRSRRCPGSLLAVNRTAREDDPAPRLAAGDHT
jgi:hypothetical protein